VRLSRLASVLAPAAGKAILGAPRRRALVRVPEECAGLLSDGFRLPDYVLVGGDMRCQILGSRFEAGNACFALGQRCVLPSDLGLDASYCRFDGGERFVENVGAHRFLLPGDPTAPSAPDGR
jgi:hypothetical protein